MNINSPSSLSSQKPHGDIKFMANLFEVVDPRGIRIYCTISQWNDHIVISRNNDGLSVDEEWKNLVITTIEKPIILAQDKDFSNRNVYYSRPGRSAFYMKVIIEIKRNTGRVITAFETNNVKTGERILWPIQIS